MLSHTSDINIDKFKDFETRKPIIRKILFNFYSVNAKTAINQIDFLLIKYNMHLAYIKNQIPSLVHEMINARNNINILTSEILAYEHKFLDRNTKMNYYNSIGLTNYISILGYDIAMSTYYKQLKNKLESQINLKNIYVNSFRKCIDNRKKLRLSIQKLNSDKNYLTTFINTKK